MEGRELVLILGIIGERTYLYLADFLKTNLKKFAVICLKRPQKAGFLGPIRSKIIVTKEKERRKRKNEEEEERSRRDKSNGCTLSFYNGYFSRKAKTVIYSEL